MTMIWPDWNKLVIRGDAKAMGVPRSDEERKIIEAITNEEERKEVIEQLRNWIYKKSEDRFKDVPKKVLEEALAKANIPTEGISKKADLVKLFEDSGLSLEELVKTE